MYKDDPDAGLVKMGIDITGNGQPDLVISEWSGYANCCLTFHIFEIGPTFKKLGTIDAEFGDRVRISSIRTRIRRTQGSRFRFTTGRLRTGTPISPTRPRRKYCCASATAHIASRPT